MFALSMRSYFPLTKRHRHGIKATVAHGEAGSVSEVVANEERLRVQKMLQDYDLKDIYNFDETRFSGERCRVEDSQWDRFKASSKGRSASLSASAAMQAVQTNLPLRTLGNPRDPEPLPESRQRITAIDTGVTRKHGLPMRCSAISSNDSMWICATTKDGISFCL